MNGNGNNKKKRRKLYIYAGIGLGLVLLIAIGVFAATRGGTKIDPSKLAKVEKGDLAKSVVATGKVTPIIKVEVKSKASGIVKKLLVDYGDHVKKGQLLVQLDKIEIEAQVEQSKAALEAAQANLKGSQADYERAKVLFIPTGNCALSIEASTIGRRCEPTNPLWPDGVSGRRSTRNRCATSHKLTR